jgi:hypothetical protein
MTHSTPTRYGPVKTPGISHEPGGHVVSCKCRWLRFYEHDEDARRRSTFATR